MREDKMKFFTKTKDIILRSQKVLHVFRSVLVTRFIGEERLGSIPPRRLAFARTSFDFNIHSFPLSGEQKTRLYEGEVTDFNPFPLFSGHVRIVSDSSVR